MAQQLIHRCACACARSSPARPRRYLQAAADAASSTPDGSSLNLADWTDVTWLCAPLDVGSTQPQRMAPIEIPRQVDFKANGTEKRNKSDCAVYMCITAMSLALRCAVDFSLARAIPRAR